YVLGPYALKCGGVRGIRTLDTGLSPYNALAGRPLRPLGHHSGGGGILLRFGDAEDAARCWLAHLADDLQRSDAPREVERGEIAHPAAGLEGEDLVLQVGEKCTQQPLARFRVGARRDRIGSDGRSGEREQ